MFPLKGKPLNPRDEADSKVRANEELTNIVKIMGIDRKTAYTRETVRKLRYGSIMIMADQDVDGSHIKGLIINFLHWYNPSLLKCSGFLKQFITPLIRATKGKVIRTFFTAAEFLEWRRAEIEEGHRAGLGGDAGLSKWRIKYYKGLGTSTAKEAKEYFGNLNKHVLGFDPMTVSTAESRQQRQLQLQQQQQEDQEQRMEVVGVDDVEGEIVDVVVDAATLVKREDERWAALSDETWIKVRECLVPLSLSRSPVFVAYRSFRVPFLPAFLPALLSLFPSLRHQLVFGKGVSTANKRKEWLIRYKVDEDNAETTSVDYTTASMTLRHFFEKEMIVYSMASVVRAIPSVMDGLKPSQRKVMYVGLLLFSVAPQILRCSTFADARCSRPSRGRSAPIYAVLSAGTHVSGDG